MSSKKNVVGVENFQRRTWDIEEYEKKAAEREKKGDKPECLFVQ